MGVEKYRTPTEEEMKAAWFAYSKGGTDEVKDREFNKYLAHQLDVQNKIARSRIVRTMGTLRLHNGVIWNWSPRTNEGIPPENAEGDWKDWFDFGFRTAWKEFVDIIRED